MEQAYPPAAQTSNRGMISLVLGILGLVCCAILGPFAWYLGKAELSAIKRGETPQAGEGIAMAGMILGIVGTAMLILSILWVVFFGGLAVLATLAESH